MPLVNHLKEYRARIGVNQQELGALVGTSRQTVSQIERGDYSPSVTLALKIAKVCNATVEDIFEHPQDPYTKSLIAAITDEKKNSDPIEGEPALEVKDLSVYYVKKSEKLGEKPKKNVISIKLQNMLNLPTQISYQQLHQHLKQLYHRL